jgi:hypothetical protein
MVQRMLCKEPAGRGTMAEHLSAQRGAIFPEYFYSFLQAYMRMFSHRPLMSADQKVQLVCFLFVSSVYKRVMSGRVMLVVPALVPTQPYSVTSILK